MPFNPRQQTNYFTTLRQLVRGNEAFRATVYQPNDHVPTIAYGFTFIRFGGTWNLYERLDADMAAIGRPLTRAQRDSLQDIADARNAGNNVQADTLITQFSTSFGAITEQDAQTLFQQDVNYRGTLINGQFRSVLGSAAGDALFNSLAGTTEMMAIFDIAYYRGAGGLRAELIQAMSQNDRAAAWYELRYHELPANPQPGHSLRNYRDAELFSLYDTQGSATPEEARGIYRLYTDKHSSIESYENSYPPPSNVSSLISALFPAKNSLIDWVRTSKGIGIDADSFSGIDILLASDLGQTLDGTYGDYRNAANVLIGDNGADRLIGGTGDDILIGGGDIDTLEGGAGNDTLYGNDGQGGDLLKGGLGNDIYYADNGDIIYDEDGIGTIYVGQSKTRLTGGERKADEAFFTSADKSQVYQENPGGSIDVWTSEGHITIQPSPGNPGPRAQPTSDGSPGVQSGQPGLGSPLISPKPKDPPPADPFNGAKGAVCPLILDLDGNGVQVTTLADGVYFDHDGNGFVESTAWVGGNDGLLVWDKNHDGKITTGNELFGDRTLLKNGRWGQNGFDVLVEYDDNHDGKIDANDALWSNLQLWVDANHNGISSAAELHSLADYGIQSFDTAYVVEQEIDGATQRGSYTKTDGSQANAVDDRRFVADFVDTKVSDWVPVTPEIAALPDLKGYGNVYDLRQAMARDASGALMNLVQQFSATESSALRGTLLSQILIKWTDSDHVESGSRNNWMWNTSYDAQNLAVLEKFNGTPFFQPFAETGPTANPIAQAVPLLDQSYAALFGMMYSQLMAQTHLKWLYDKLVFEWDETSQRVSANQDNVISALVDLLVADRPKGVETVRDYALSVVDSPWSSAIDLGIFTQTMGAQGDDVGAVLSEVANIKSSGELISGSDGDDTLLGYFGNDVISGMGGNDLLVGDSGEDSLFGGAGNDTLDGGAGEDYLSGGMGDDVYLLGRGSGQDTVDENDNAVGNIDTIRLAAGVAPGDVTIRRDASNLYFGIKGSSGSVKVRGWFGDPAHRVEKVQFADGTVWDTAIMPTARFIGTESGEPIYGSSGDDVIEGLGGDDYLVGGAGNDTYMFGHGSGQDTIYDCDTTEGNSDTIFLKSDVAPGDVRLWRDTSNLYLSINGSSDRITVQSWFDDPAYRVEQVQFADGTVWDASLLQIAKFLGTDAADYIAGSAGNDLIEGMGNDDYLAGSLGNDTLDGGTGNDTLDGGAGNDTYMFGRGYGQDTIYDCDTTEGNSDTIFLKSDVAPGDVRLWRDTSNLYLSINGSSDRITVQGWFDDPAYRVEQVQFADGTVWDASLLQIAKFLGTDAADYIAGSAGNDLIEGMGNDDYLAGSLGNDTLDGGTGNDTLDGGAGNDTYMFGRGYGQDTITDYDSTAGNSDAVRLAADVLPADVTLWRDTSNLYLGINGSSDRITVQSWFDGPAYRVERIEFADGTVWDTAVMQRAKLIGTESGDYLYGSSGDDVIEGLGGDDYLLGGAGNATYVFGHGDGQDTISDYDTTEGNSDTILLKPDVAPGDVTLWRDASSLYFDIDGSSDRITVQNWFADPAYRVEKVEFADGTVWDSAVMQAAKIVGTESGDYLYGSSGDDVIEGLGGDDYLVGGAGNDALNGGTGNDALDGGAGNDTYVFGRGYGQDTISDYDPAEGNSDTILLKSDVAPGDVTLWRDTSNLYLGINGSSDRITVQSWFDDPAYRVEKVQFIDGTVWDSVIMQAAKFLGTDAVDYIAGSDGNDVIEGLGSDDYLVGSLGNDTLNGGMGNDTLDGGTGNDAYVFGRGDGQDTISDYDPAEGNSDTILLKPDVVSGDVTLWRDTSTLYLGINGSSDRITVQSWFDDSTYRVEKIQFADGTAWDSATMQAAIFRGTDAADSITGTVGNDTIEGLGGDDGLSGSAGNDILDGGTGNDSLDGGDGDDTYLFGRGYGVDSVYETSGSADTIKLNVDVSPVDIMVSCDSSNLYFNIRGTTDKLVIQNWYADSVYQIERTEFADGTVWDAAALTARLNAASELADFYWGSVGDDTFNALGGDDQLMGNDGNDTLSGGAGNDLLDGGTGADVLAGGAGDDTYVVDNIADVVTENPDEGTDAVQSSITYALGANVENLTLTGATATRGTGNVLNNVLIGNSANNTLTGGDGNDTLDGGLGSDTMVGGLGDDTYVVNAGTDVVTEAASAGNDTVQSSVTLTLGSNVENLVLTGTSAINGTGNTQNNLVRGNSAVNTLNGGAGNDALEGGAGNDVLTDASGAALFGGGAGNDTITGGSGAEIFLGGVGNDTYTTGAGNDVILFNKGDGQDTLAAGDSGQGTLSLGGGALYSDLSFTKASNDLVLKVGASDQITFKSWYAATPTRSVLNLQVMAEAMADFAAGGSDPLRDQKVENFSFAGLVGAFDTARVANPGLSSWALTNALANFHLAGSDSAALGGDLAYQYGKNGTLAGIGITSALDVLNSAALGASAQVLTPLAGLQSGTQRLS